MEKVDGQSERDKDRELRCSFIGDRVRLWIYAPSKKGGKANEMSVDVPPDKLFAALARVLAAGPEK